METLIAMMILSISLVTILQLFSGGLRSGRLSDEYTRAIFHAREKMEEVLLAERLAEGESEGEFEDGYLWSVKIASPEPEDELEDADAPKVRPPVDLFQITVAVAWGTGNSERQFEISTVHIAEKIRTEDDA